MPRGITSGIIYIPLDVRWPRSKKVRAMIVEHGERGFAAWGLYLAMACYCRENLSDGFVPAAEIGALAYPLPADLAAGLVALLADARLIDPSGSHNGPHSEPQSDSHTAGYLVRAYVKRNGTRAETLDHAAKVSAAGRTAALTRWSEGTDTAGNASRNADRMPDIDRDRDKRRARAPGRVGAPARDDGEGWSPSGVLDQPPAAARRGRPIARPAAQIIADMHRPGGPATDDQRAARAEEARKGLANRPARLGDPEPDPAARLHGEALARAQVAEIAAQRRAEPAIATAEDDQGDPLGLGGGREVEGEDGEWHVEPADPEDRPGRGDADNPGRADPPEPDPEDFGELTEPADDEYPF